MCLDSLSIILTASASATKNTAMFADPKRFVILGNFHELILSMESASDSEVLDMESDEPAKRFRTPQGKAWSFDREWECALFDVARTTADSVVDHDI